MADEVFVIGEGGTVAPEELEKRPKVTPQGVSRIAAPSAPVPASPEAYDPSADFVLPEGQRQGGLSSLLSPTGARIGSGVIADKVLASRVPGPARVPISAGIAEVAGQGVEVARELLGFDPPQSFGQHIKSGVKNFGTDVAGQFGMQGLLQRPAEKLANRAFKSAETGGRSADFRGGGIEATPAAVTGSDSLRRAQNLLGDLFPSAAPIDAMRALEADSVLRENSRLRGRIGSVGKTEASIGQRVREEYLESRNLAKETYSDAISKIDQELSVTQSAPKEMVVETTKKGIQKVVPAKAQPTSAPDFSGGRVPAFPLNFTQKLVKEEPHLVNALLSNETKDLYLKGLKEPLSREELSLFRTKAGKMVDSAGNSLSARDRSQIYAALDDDMRQGLAQKVPEAAVQRWDEANSLYSQWSEVDEGLNKLVGSSDAGAFKLVQAGSKEDIAKLQKLEQVVSNDTMKAVKQKIIERMGQKTPGGEFEMGEFIKDSQYGKLSDEAKTFLLGKDRDAWDLFHKNVKNVVESRKGSGEGLAANGVLLGLLTGTGAGATTAALGGGGSNLATGIAATGGGLITMPALASALISSDRFIQWANRAAEIKPWNYGAARSLVDQGANLLRSEADKKEFRRRGLAEVDAAEAKAQEEGKPTNRAEAMFGARKREKK